jgi:hypothetical protein
VHVQEVYEQAVGKIDSLAAEMDIKLANLEAKTSDERAVISKITAALKDTNSAAQSAQDDVKRLQQVLRQTDARLVQVHVSTLQLELLWCLHALELLRQAQMQLL